MLKTSELLLPLHELGLAEDLADDYDVAEANLVCACDLSGAEGLDVNAKLKRLAEIANDVERTIFFGKNYDLFLSNPGKFHNSQGFFCVVCMVSILKTKYGVRYNPR